MSTNDPTKPKWTKHTDMFMDFANGGWAQGGQVYRDGVAAFPWGCSKENGKANTPVIVQYEVDGGHIFDNSKDACEYYDSVHPEEPA